MLNCCDPVICPACISAGKAKYRKGVPWRPQLLVSVDNYHGTGSDIANCPECGKGYQVTFKVDTVIYCEHYDRDFEAEERDRQQSKAEHIQSLKDKIKELEAA